MSGVETGGVDLQLSAGGEPHSPQSPYPNMLQTPTQNIAATPFYLQQARGSEGSLAHDRALPRENRHQSVSPSRKEGPDFQPGGL